MVRVSSPPKSRSKAVVCVSTPRMYPRSGYFLVFNKIAIPFNNTYTEFCLSWLYWLGCLAGAFYALQFRISRKIYLEPLNHALLPCQILLPLLHGGANDQFIVDIAVALYSLVFAKSQNFLQYFAYLQTAYRQ